MKEIIAKFTHNFQLLEVFVYVFISMLFSSAVDFSSAVIVATVRFQLGIGTTITLTPIWKWWWCSVEKNMCIISLYCSTAEIIVCYLCVCVVCSVHLLPLSAYVYNRHTELQCNHVAVHVCTHQMSIGSVCVCVCVYC